MLRLGFTGTRKGLTPKQRESLEFFFACMIQQHGDIELHHGDCVGADCHAHEMALARNFSIVIHPPKKEVHRAFCRAEDPGDNVTILPALSYLDRNDMIVASTTSLVACPKQAQKVRRSGTWYTINRAIEQGRAVAIIQPSGNVVTICPRPEDSEDLLDDWRPLEDEMEA